MRNVAFGFAVSTLFVLTLSAPADWPQFRGPDGAGVADGNDLPVKWSKDENIRWKAALPGKGLSSPVVAGGKVFLTSCSAYQESRLHVLCFEAATGKQLWERQFWSTGSTTCHPKTNMAAPTPVTDGKSVYTLFATGDLAAFDADGNLLWYRALARDYPQITNQVGMAASPALFEDILLVPMENAGDSFAAGIDTRTGKNRWKVERPRDINWTTPLVVRQPGRIEALFMSPKGLTAYDPGTGRERWSYRGTGVSPIPSLAQGAGLVVLPGGVALKPAGDNVATAWTSSKLRAGTGSPLCYRGRVYTVNNAGNILSCFDLKDGKSLWQERIQGPVSASPVAADGKLYVVNEEGATTVMAVDNEPKILTINPLAEPMLATPAIAGSALYLRSDQHLYCIAKTPAASSPKKSE